MLIRPSLLALLLCACAAPPRPPLQPPAVETDLQYWAGTVLTGPRPEPEAADRVAADDALSLLCRVSYVAEMPQEPLQPLASRTRLVVSARGDDPLLPTAHLAIGARVGSGAAARGFVAEHRRASRVDSRAMFELRGALPQGVTASFRAESVDTIFRSGVGAVRRAIAIQISREGGVLTAALQVDSLDPESPSGTDHVLERQIVLLEDVPGLRGDPLVIAIPSPFDPFGHNAFVAEVRVGAPSRDGMHRAAVEECIAGLRASGSEARADAAGLDSGETRSLTLANSLRALNLAAHHRAAIVFLTSTNEAPLALDLALSADETTLAAWLQVFMTETGATIAEDTRREDLDWDLDRTAWRVLAQQLNDDQLSTGLRGLLALHAGEVGRFGGEILETLDRSPDRTAFEAELLADNRRFLTSPDPASRVRALDWLRERGQAPQGYDPLAPRNERREALGRDRLKRQGADR